jgi:hypothetical protein
MKMAGGQRERRGGNGVRRLLELELKRKMERTGEERREEGASVTVLNRCHSHRDFLRG